MRKFAKDGVKLIHNLSIAPSASTPHLYISALPFVPQNSVLYRAVREKFPHVAKVVEGYYEGWPAAQVLLQGHTDYVNMVAFSPDGNRIVSGSDDNTVRVWDPEMRVRITKDVKENASLSLNEGNMSFSMNGKYSFW